MARSESSKGASYMVRKGRGLSTSCSAKCSVSTCKELRRKILSLAEIDLNVLIHTYIHTYILYCYLPDGAFQEQLFKLLKLLITTQLKLIKFKKHLQHYLNFVVEKNTKNK